MAIVFVSRAYAAEPEVSRREVAAIAEGLSVAGHLPIAPQIYLPQFIDEATERDLALSLCLALVALSDEIRVYGEQSAGMRLEIAEARRLGIPVIDGETADPMSAKRVPPRRASARAAVER